jgi:hypothetical protein
VRADRLFRDQPDALRSGRADRHCDPPTLRRTLAWVGAPVQLHVVEDGPRLQGAQEIGQDPQEIETEIMTTLAGWIRSVLGD